MHWYVEHKGATYLFSYRDSSYRPRSSWSASLSGPPGIFYSRSTDLTPASGLSPSGKALQPRRRSFPFLRKLTWSHFTPITFTSLKEKRKNCGSLTIGSHHQSTASQAPYLTRESFHLSLKEPGGAFWRHVLAINRLKCWEDNAWRTGCYS